MVSEAFLFFPLFRLGTMGILEISTACLSLSLCVLPDLVLAPTLPALQSQLLLLPRQVTVLRSWIRESSPERTSTSQDLSELSLEGLRSSMPPSCCLVVRLLLLLEQRRMLRCLVGIHSRCSTAVDSWIWKSSPPPSDLGFCSVGRAVRLRGVSGRHASW